MKYLTSDRIGWLEESLQGLAFWIGHRRALYKDYPLSESAIVSEACNLINANLPDGLKIIPECMYRRIVPIDSSLSSAVKTGRADLVICETDAKNFKSSNNISKNVKFVFEVKRANSKWKSIVDDLIRLSECQYFSSDNARSFLIVVGENHVPENFVSNGIAKPGKKPIPGSTGSYKVRRVLKAAVSFSNRSSAHYVSLVEVYK